MSDASPLIRPRWRPRFTLRTLLLGALLFGSAMLLWSNRKPWATRCIIQEKRPIEESRFSQDDSLIYTHIIEKKDESQPDSKSTDIVTIYDAATGAPRRTWTYDRQTRHGNYFSFSPAGHYMSRHPGRLWDDPYTGELWSVDTGQSIQLIDQKPDDFCVLRISPEDHFALVWSCGQTALVALPDCRVIARLQGFGYGTFSSDEKWLAYHRETSNSIAQLVSTETGTIGAEFGHDSKCREVEFTKDNQLLFYMIQRKKNGPCVGKAIDLASGKQIDDFEFNLDGPYEKFQFSEDGAYLLTRHEKSYVIWNWSSNTVAFRGEAEYSENPLILLDGRLLDSEPLTALDLQTGRPLIKLTASGTFAPNGRTAYDAENCALINGLTGTTIQKFGHFPDSKNDTSNGRFRLKFARQRPEFLTYIHIVDIDGTEVTTDPIYNTQVRVWHRRRPEEWWGISYLPEFWLVTVLGCAFLWSLAKMPK